MVNQWFTLHFILSNHTYSKLQTKFYIILYNLHLSDFFFIYQIF